MERFIEIEPNLEEIVKRLEKLVISPEKGILGQRQDVAAELGMTPSHLSQAIKRNSIPYAKLYTYSRVNNISLDWILDGINLDRMLKKHELHNFEILVTLNKGKVFELLCLDIDERLHQMKLISEDLTRKDNLMQRAMISLSNFNNMSLVNLTILKLEDIGMNIKITKYPEDIENYEPYWMNKIYECTIDRKQYRIVHCENFNVASNYIGVLANGTKQEENFRRECYNLLRNTSEEIVLIMAKRFGSNSVFMDE